MPTGEYRCLAAPWDTHHRGSSCCCITWNCQMFLTCSPAQRTVLGVTQMLQLSAAMRFWSALAVEEAQVSYWWVAADLAIGFRVLWSQLYFCLRSDMTAAMLHGTCASVSAPLVLVNPGRSSQESSMTGSVWQQQRSQPPAAPDSKSGVHHMGYIVAGERRRITHTHKLTQRSERWQSIPLSHPWSARAVHLKQVLAAYESGMAGNGSKCHSRCSSMARKRAARTGFRWKKYPNLNTNSLPSLRLPLPFPSLSCFGFVYSGGSGL